MIYVPAAGHRGLYLVSPRTWKRLILFTGNETMTVAQDCVRLWQWIPQGPPKLVKVHLLASFNTRDLVTFGALHPPEQYYNVST
jgi:hypothetical protein